MRLGGPIFDSWTTPQEFVDLHLKHGFSAAYCPMTDDYGLLDEVAHALAESDIVIAESGWYCVNFLDTDPTLRRKNIDLIIGKLEYAERAGALCCVIHGGTIQTGGWGAINPENISRQAFDETVTIVQAIIDAVKPKRTRLTIEMTSWLFPYSVDTYLDLLRCIDRPEFAVHLDPVNILDSPVACYKHAEIIKDCFSRLGDRIMSCHSKDLVLEGVYEPILIHETYTGNGMIDYDTYLTELAKLDGEPPLMIEHLTADQLPKAVDFIFDKASELGIEIRNADKRG